MVLSACCVLAQHMLSAASPPQTHVFSMCKSLSWPLIIHQWCCMPRSDAPTMSLCSQLCMTEAESHADNRPCEGCFADGCRSAARMRSTSSSSCMPSLHPCPPSQLPHKQLKPTHLKTSTSRYAVPLAVLDCLNASRCCAPVQVHVLHHRPRQLVHSLISHHVLLICMMT